MSRVIPGYASERYVQSVGSDAQVSAFSFACWINMADYQSDGGTVFVKDPTDDYFTYLQILADGTIFAACGTNYLGAANSVTIAVPGTGYTTNDTGFLHSPNPNIPANLAEYRIGGAPGGIPTDPVGLLGGGTGYANGQLCTTTTGGGQPGSGVGLTLIVSSIINTTNATSTSVETVPIGTWTHVAMTWDADGDGLVHVYINGVECTYKGIRTASIHPCTTTGPYVFGDDLGGLTLAGSLDELVVCGNTALSGAQVASLAASSDGVPAPLLPFVTDYWHVCGLTSPEPNAKNPTNVGNLSTPAPVAAGDSPGYSCGSTPPGPSAAGNNVVDSLSRCCSRVLP